MKANANRLAKLITRTGVIACCSMVLNAYASTVDQTLSVSTQSQAQKTPSSLSPEQVARLQQLPRYQRVTGISGNLSSVGSDTLANLMTYWTEEYKRLYPNVNIQVQAAGSSTAPTALTEATAQLGPMSRMMKAREVEAFEQEYGYKPTSIRVAIDALAVFVHEDNPLQGINFEQLDAVYSRTLRCGATQP